MRNRINDLNNHMFELIEDLLDKDIKGDDLQETVLRAKTAAMVAGQVVEIGKLGLAAKSMALEYGEDTPRVEVIE